MVEGILTSRYISGVDTNNIEGKYQQTEHVGRMASEPNQSNMIGTTIRVAYHGRNLARDMLFGHLGVANVRRGIIEDQ